MFLIMSRKPPGFSINLTERERRGEMNRIESGNRGRKGLAGPHEDTSVDNPQGDPGKMFIQFVIEPRYVFPGMLGGDP